LLAVELVVEAMAVVAVLVVIVIALAVKPQVMVLAQKLWLNYRQA
tara:strand:+ start:35 stop:169 length:135 start_codon:yes stop_codon:yes gene_type:complete